MIPIPVVIKTLTQAHQLQLRLLAVTIISLIWNYAHCQSATNFDSIPLFNKIKLMGDIGVVCEIDSLSSCTINYSDSSYNWSDISFLTIDDNTLTIQLLEDYRIEQQKLKPLIVRTSTLNSIENAYDSTIVVKGKISGSSLDIKQSGNGQIIIDSISVPKLDAAIITGKGLIDITNVQTQDLSCRIIGTGSISIKNGNAMMLKCNTVGTGKLNLSGLVSEKVRISYSGGGYIDCNVIKELTTYGLGTTKIRYIGSPKINRRGNVKPKRIDTTK